MRRMCMKVFLSVILLTGLCSLRAQDEMFKALFMYNFTKDIEWPADYKQGNFVIAVLGTSSVVAELEKIAQTKKVGNQPIQVIKANDAAGIGKCHLVYVTPAKSGQLSQIASGFARKPVLVVSDKSGGAKEGASINFNKVDGKQKFEINTATIANQGLKVTSFLISLGIAVQ